MTSNRTPCENNIGIYSTPLADIKPDALVATLLTAKGARSYNRMGNVTAIATGALRLASECMAPALGRMALEYLGVDAASSLDRQIQAGPWNISARWNPARTGVDMLLRHKDRPGAWHFGLAYDPKESVQGQTIRAQLVSQAKLAGMSHTAIMMAEILGKKEWAAFVRNPDNYRASEVGDRVAYVYGTALSVKPGETEALCLPGVPTAVEKTDAAPLTDLWPRDLAKPLNIWWSGIALSYRPSINAPSDEEHLSRQLGNEGRSDPFSGIELLSTLCEVLAHFDLDTDVQAVLKHLHQARFWDTNVGNSTDIFEIGVGLVRDDGGLIAHQTRTGLNELSTKLIGHDLEEDIERVADLAHRLVTKGHTSQAKAYVCNDLNDSGYVEAHDGILSLHLGTQNGRFRVDLAQDPSEVRLYRTTVSQVLLASFAGDSNGLTALHPVEYNARQIRDLNTILLTLSSMSVCIENE